MTSLTEEIIACLPARRSHHLDLQPAHPLM